jgi:hypothetical protein
LVKQLPRTRGKPLDKIASTPAIFAVDDQQLLRGPLSRAIFTASTWVNDSFFCFASVLKTSAKSTHDFGTTSGNSPRISTLLTRTLANTMPLVPFATTSMRSLISLTDKAAQSLMDISVAVGSPFWLPLALSFHFETSAPNIQKFFLISMNSLSEFRLSVV